MSTTSRIVTAACAGFLVLTLAGCGGTYVPSPEVSDTPTTAPPEAQEEAVTPGAVENVHHLCKAVQPSLTAWQTNSARMARASFNIAVTEWAVRHDVSMRSLMAHPHDLDVAMAQRCPYIWKETKIALATPSVGDTLIGH